MTTELALALNNLTAAVTHYGQVFVNFLSALTLCAGMCTVWIFQIARNTKR